MSQLNLVCLSLTPNLRCVGFTLGQSETLIIPPVIEVILSLFFIYLYPGPGRRAQILLVADAVLYFIWALLDMLSHVVPAAQTSLPVFKGLDLLIGVVSFTPILLYSIYLYRLSFRDFIPTLPRKLHPYLEISLPILLLMAVAINEVSSFVGTQIGKSSNQHLVVEFSHNSNSLWLSLSRSSLAIYTIIQFLFFLLAFSRLARAFLDQRRIELTHSDENHYYHGIAWITAGIITGVIEAISGFAQVSFGVALARRILRLSARGVLMYGSLKGLDVAENFETLTDELRSVSHISRRISRMLGISPQQANMFHRISQSHPEQTRASERPSAEKQSGNQRVTIRCEKGHAPLLQIRFSTFDILGQAMLADAVQQRQRSQPVLVPGRTSAGSRAQQHEENVSDDHDVAPDWIRPLEKCHARQESGGTVSDSLSVVRELERRFPNLPPRVTGKYRGSILGQNYEEDPFPVLGVSRQCSLRRDGGACDPSEQGGTSVALSPSSSIKRKPAPPLLENISYASDRYKCPVSTWGGLTQNTVNYPVNSPAVTNSPSEDTTVCDPSPAPVGERNTSRLRKMSALDIIQRASRAMSDASIRSAEWLASASASRSTRTPLTATDIEMYRRGNIGPGSARPRSSMGGASLLSGENLLSKARSSTDDVGAYSKPSWTHPITRISIGEIPIRTTPTPIYAELESGCERVSSSYGSVNLNEVQS